MWDLVPWPGIEPRPPALWVRSLSHWTTRQVPCYLLLPTKKCHSPPGSTGMKSLATEVADLDTPWKFRVKIKNEVLYAWENWPNRPSHSKLFSGEDFMTQISFMFLCLEISKIIKGDISSSWLAATFYSDVYSIAPTLPKSHTHWSLPYLFLVVHQNSLRDCLLGYSL